jgi:adenylate cyclase
LRALTEARQAMVALNEKNSESGRAPLNYGVGVHVGDVMYGNIGSRTRLDFTGPAASCEASATQSTCLRIMMRGYR